MNIVKKYEKAQEAIPKGVSPLRRSKGLFLRFG